MSKIMFDGFVIIYIFVFIICHWNIQGTFIGNCNMKNRGYKSRKETSKFTESQLSQTNWAGVVHLKMFLHYPKTVVAPDQFLFKTWALGH